MKTESQIRKLRDKVYDRPISDEAWEAIKANWMKPENQQWLEEKAKRKWMDYETHTAPK